MEITASITISCPAMNNSNALSTTPVALNVYLLVTALSILKQFYVNFINNVNNESASCSNYASHSRQFHSNEIKNGKRHLKTKRANIMLQAELMLQCMFNFKTSCHEMEIRRGG